ncbi:sensor histidine kinase [Polaromonas sp. P5_D5]
MTPRETWISVQLARTFMQNARPTLHAAVLIILVVVAMLHGRVAPWDLWVWTLATCSMTLLRYAILHAYRHRLAEADGVALREFMSLLGWAWPLSAVVWGSLMFVVYRQAPIEDQLVCIMILGGIAVVAVASGPPSLRTVSAYCNGLSASVLAALAWRIDLTRGVPSVLDTGAEMGVVLVFLWVAHVTGRRMYRAQRISLERQFDRQELIKALEERKQALAEAEAVRSSFIASAAHELRHPVHALGPYADWLTAEPEFAAQIARKIGDSTRKIDELFESLFSLAGLEPASLSVHLQPVDLAALVHTLAEEHTPQAREKGLRLRTRTAAGRAVSDPVLLTRLVGCLLSNALRNTHGGGVLLAARPRRGKWRIELWDTGTGIAHERQQTFSEGIPQQGMAEGFGLELAVVYRLSQLLGHPVGMTDRRGRGSVFWVELPRYEEVEKSEKAPRGSVPGPVIGPTPPPQATPSAAARAKHHTAVESAG